MAVNYVEIPFVIETTVPVKEESEAKATVSAVVPVVGAALTVEVRAGGNGSTTVYGTRTGSSTVGSPVTDSKGRAPFWLVEGRYTLKFSGGTPSLAPVSVDWDAVSEGQVLEAFLPAGTILAFAGSILPAGFLWADGSTVAKTTYPVLFAAIGTTYGGSSSNFILPDMRGRAPVGADNFGLTGAAGRLHANNTLGKASGLDTVTLSLSEIPEHAHGGATGVDSPDHTHNFGGNHVMLNAVPVAPAGGGGGLNTANTDNTGGRNNTHTHSITPAGGSAPHTNMPPYGVCTWIIKT